MVWFGLIVTVICNFDGEQLNLPLPIFLHLGEQVIIKGECRDWFYVRRFEMDDPLGGIIPKSYVQTLEATVIRNG